MDDVEKGIELFKRRNFDEALNIFLKELQNVEEGKSSYTKARILDYIGQSYRFLKQYENAIKFLKKALELVNENDQNQTCQLLRNLGSCYSITGNHIESLRCLEKSLRIAREVKDKESEAGLLYEIGTQHIDSGNDAKALKFLKLSLEIYEKLNLQVKADKVRREIREIELDKKEEEFVYEKIKNYKKINIDRI
ncbi:MAG: tetratricopeptide repeat protein [Candidatus Helarchaeota archaeon]